LLTGELSPGETSPNSVLGTKEWEEKEERKGYAEELMRKAFLSGFGLSLCPGYWPLNLFPIPCTSDFFHIRISFPIFIIPGNSCAVETSVVLKVYALFESCSTDVR